MTGPQPQHQGLVGVLRGTYGILWAGQCVSLLGDGVFIFALAWQLAVQWHRPALLGLLLAARVLAEIATAGLGGVLIDRLPRRTIVLGADAGCGLLLFALAATLHQPPPVPVLVVLMVGYGVLTALFRPALVAYLPELVAPDRLAAANALYYIALQAAMLVGPAIGAALLGLGSATTALQLNGASFLLAAATTVALPARPPATTSSGEGVASLQEGFRVARRAGWIGGTIVLISIINLGIIGAQRVALPRAAADRYGQLGGYGATMVAIALGAILAAWLASRARPPREPGRTTYTAALVLGMATAGFGIARGIVLAVLLGLAFGAGQQLAELWWITSLQRLLPDRLRGRVAAVADFGSLVFLPLSFAVGGVVVEAVGPQVVLLGAGAIGMLTATIGLLVPTLHRWRPLINDTAADASSRRDPRSSSLPRGQR